ncbi:MAG: 5'/3'-nucleotidase SurE [Kiloniellales bacterium]|nr:5'/3'-nucleotidase SurE [Kiloniellales bacterium]
MLRAPLDLTGARILLSNDDGIHAPGLEALERVARSLSDDVWVVAPETEQSATSHSLTLRRPLRIRHLGPQRYTIDGTPTDCVLIAVKKIMADRPPDLVLSGINQGANLGEDVTYSGTVAAAMEAALLGYPAIALSLLRRGDHEYRWETAERHAASVLRRLTSLSWPRDVLMNVNFPDVPAEEVRGIRVCRQGRRDVDSQVVDGSDPSGRPYVWVGNYMSDETSQVGSDLAALAEDAISVTPLHLDLTHGETLERLTGVFA